MMKIAVLLTVFNRREVTLRGLRSLYKAIDYLGADYQFDIYMTDDGCTDGTSEAVVKEFPDVHIIQGDGNLYWSGGMRKAWQDAINSGVEYDYYLWFNDDAVLYDDALTTMIKSYNDAGGNAIVSGAFCDVEGNVSYGGRDKKCRLISPNGKLQEIFLMNGNLVLIPHIIMNTLGNIDEAFIHSLGDWDYGCRARKEHFMVLLTPVYVGKTERHDNIPESFCNKQKSLVERLRILYSPRFSVGRLFIWEYRNIGFIRAIKSLITRHLYAIFPHIYNAFH